MTYLAPGVRWAPGYTPGVGWTGSSGGGGSSSSGGGSSGSSRGGSSGSSRGGSSGGGNGNRRLDQNKVQRWVQKLKGSNSPLIQKMAPAEIRKLAEWHVKRESGGASSPVPPKPVPGGAKVTSQKSAPKPAPSGTIRYKMEHGTANPQEKAMYRATHSVTAEGVAKEPYTLGPHGTKWTESMLPFVDPVQAAALRYAAATGVPQKQRPEITTYAFSPQKKRDLSTVQPAMVLPSTTSPTAKANKLGAEPLTRAGVKRSGKEVTATYAVLEARKGNIKTQEAKAKAAAAGIELLQAPLMKYSDLGRPLTAKEAYEYTALKQKTAPKLKKAKQELAAASGAAMMGVETYNKGAKEYNLMAAVQVGREHALPIFEKNVAKQKTEERLVHTAKTNPVRFMGAVVPTMLLTSSGEAAGYNVLGGYLGLQSKESAQRQAMAGIVAGSQEMEQVFKPKPTGGISGVAHGFSNLSPQAAGEMALNPFTEEAAMMVGAPMAVGALGKVGSKVAPRLTPVIGKATMAAGTLMASAYIAAPSIGFATGGKIPEGGISQSFGRATKIAIGLAAAGEAYRMGQNLVAPSEAAPTGPAYAEINTEGTGEMHPSLNPPTGEVKPADMSSLSTTSDVSLTRGGKLVSNTKIGQETNELIRYGGRKPINTGTEGFKGAVSQEAGIVETATTAPEEGKPYSKWGINKQLSLTKAVSVGNEKVGIIDFTTRSLGRSGYNKEFGRQYRNFLFETPEASYVRVRAGSKFIQKPLWGERVGGEHISDVVIAVPKSGAEPVPLKPADYANIMGNKPIGGSGGGKAFTETTAAQEKAMEAAGKAALSIKTPKVEVATETNYMPYTTAGATASLSITKEVTKPPKTFAKPRPPIVITVPRVKAPKTRSELAVTAAVAVPTTIGINKTTTKPFPQAQKQRQAQAVEQINPSAVDLISLQAPKQAVVEQEITAVATPTITPPIPPTKFDIGKPIPPTPVSAGKGGGGGFQMPSWGVGFGTPRRSRGRERAAPKYTLLDVFAIEARTGKEALQPTGKRARHMFERTLATGADFTEALYLGKKPRKGKRKKTTKKRRGIKIF